MKKTILFGIIALFAISLVMAVECENNPLENCDISTTTAFNTTNSPYNLNDTDTNGAIRVNTSNIIIDFNMSYIYGNNTASSIGILIDPELTNITFNNFNVSNYTYSVRINSTLQPNIASTSLDVMNMTYSYDNTIKQLTIYCDGEGTIGLDQLSNIGGSLGYYTIYHDGAYVSDSKSDSYTINSCSTWTFIKTDNIRDSLTTSESSLFFVMIFLIIFGGIYALIQNPSIGFVVVFLGASLAIYLLRSLL